MSFRRGVTHSIIGAITLGVALQAVRAQTTQSVNAAPSDLTSGSVAGLYQMLDPRGYADALTAATYLRLLPDGRSRLEAIMVKDAGGSITSQTEIGTFHRTPWSVRQTPGGPELCFDAAGKSQCAQVERDAATNDLLLYSTTRPRGRADLRLHKIAAIQTKTGTD
jgi:hypothetical protein